MWATRKFTVHGFMNPLGLQLLRGYRNSASRIASDLEVNQILSKALNKNTSTAISCTVIDTNGRVTASHQKFKKADLVSKFCLLPRDLRKIDASTHNLVPAVLVRDNATVLNLLFVRAILTKDCVLIADVPNLDPDTVKLQSVFLYDLQHRLRLPYPQTSLRYEERVLETILVSVISTLETELKMHDLRVHSVQRELERSLDKKTLRSLLVQSKSLNAFVQKATLIRDELEELLDNDDDLNRLSGLQLASENTSENTSAVNSSRPTTEPVLKPKPETDPASVDSQVELMLESYYTQCDEIVQNASNLETTIHSTEEYINILLDSNRNALMMLEVRFQIGMLGLSSGSALAALYGMNLKNFIEEANYGFPAVCVGVVIFSLSAMGVCLRRLSRMTRKRL